MEQGHRVGGGDRSVHMSGVSGGKELRYLLACDYLSLFSASTWPGLYLPFQLGTEQS